MPNCCKNCVSYFTFIGYRGLKAMCVKNRVGAALDNMLLYTEEMKNRKLPEYVPDIEVQPDFCCKLHTLEHRKKK